MSFIIFQHLLLEALFDVFYFPFWWYSGGVKHAAKWYARFVRQGNARLAPGLWLKNIFTPMFGQHDWQGRLISFFMRVVNVIGRGFALGVWLLVGLSLFCLWLLFPLFVLVGIVFSLAKLAV